MTNPTSRILFIKDQSTKHTPDLIRLVSPPFELVDFHRPELTHSQQKVALLEHLTAQQYSAVVTPTDARFEDTIRAQHPGPIVGYGVMELARYKGFIGISASMLSNNLGQYWADEIQEVLRGSR